MNSLRLKPEAFPTKEKLVLVPTFRGVSGSATFTIERTEDKINFGVKAQLGMLLFKNALNFEATCLWQKTHSVWSVIDYVEINHKSGKRRSSLEGIKKAQTKYAGEQIMGPLSLLYSLRVEPLREVGDVRIGYAGRAENPISVELVAKEKKKKIVKALGGERDVLRLELLIETPKSAEKVKVFSDGKAALWIDQKTNLIVEVGYEIPPFGTLSMALDQVV